MCRMDCLLSWESHLVITSNITSVSGSTSSWFKLNLWKSYMPIKYKNQLCRYLKNRQSRKQIMVSSNLSKNERNALRIVSWVDFVRFLGEEAINCFRDLLTFSLISLMELESIRLGIYFHQNSCLGENRFHEIVIGHLKKTAEHF